MVTMARLIEVYVEDNIVKGEILSNTFFDAEYLIELLHNCPNRIENLCSGTSVSLDPKNEGRLVDGITSKGGVISLDGSYDVAVKTKRGLIMILFDPCEESQLPYILYRDCSQELIHIVGKNKFVPAII